jgi:hypothetical protein
MGLSDLLQRSCFCFTLRTLSPYRVKYVTMRLPNPGNGYPSYTGVERIGGD